MPYQSKLRNGLEGTPAGSRRLPILKNTQDPVIVRFTWHFAAAASEAPVPPDLAAPYFTRRRPPGRPLAVGSGRGG